MALPKSIIVAVNFPSSSKPYHYNCEWTQVQVGDIVQTPTGMAKVVGFAGPEAYGGSLKSIVAWYSADGSVRKVARDRRITELRAELSRLMDAHEFRKRMTTFAKTSPEARKLLKELLQLEKQK